MFCLGGTEDEGEGKRRGVRSRAGRRVAVDRRVWKAGGWEGRPT